MLWKAHQSHGRLPWAKLFDPAIRLAEKGFPISPRLHKMLTRDPVLKYDPFAASYFYRPDGTAKPIGTVIVNRTYAETLKKIAEQGERGFYRGEVAGKIVDAVAGHPDNPGLLTLGDLATYEAKERPPLCGTYRGLIICGMAPPSSGGFTVLQILSLLEGFDLAAAGAGSVSSVHLISEASRLAYADRDHYLGDWDFVNIPMGALLDGGYIKSRAQMIDPARAAGRKRLPGGPDELAFEDDIIDPSQPSTTHFSIIDEGGNAVSMTASVEAPFGAHLMAAGFILNNQLTDFAFDPTPSGRPHPNRVEGGKRPRSSMSPTMVFDENWNLKLIIGSPGGNRIIAYVTQTIVGVLDQGLDIQTAIDAPRHVNRNGKTELEQGTALEIIAPALAAMGHDIDIREITSGLHGIHITRDENGRTLTGGADPRREGVVLGD